MNDLDTDKNTRHHLPFIIVLAGGNTSYYKYLNKKKLDRMEANNGDKTQQIFEIKLQCDIKNI